MNYDNFMPQGYRCEVCRVTNCKLWRPYMSTRRIRLMCAVHICAEAKIPVHTLDANGTRFSTFFGVEGRTDQIGGYVPAIPCADDWPGIETYWGYTTVPPEAIQWWRLLPTISPQFSEEELVQSRNN